MVNQGLVNRESGLGLTDLLVFLGHPFVPVVEHVQPLGLSLPQNLCRNVLRPGGGGQRSEVLHILTHMLIMSVLCVFLFVYFVFICCKKQSVSWIHLFSKAEL